MLGMGEGGEEGGQVGKDKKEGIEDGKGCHGRGSWYEDFGWAVG